MPKLNDHFRILGKKLHARPRTLFSYACDPGVAAGRTLLVIALDVLLVLLGKLLLKVWKSHLGEGSNSLGSRHKGEQCVGQTMGVRREFCALFEGFGVGGAFLYIAAQFLRHERHNEGRERNYRSHPVSFDSRRSKSDIRRNLR